MIIVEVGKRKIEYALKEFRKKLDDSKTLHIYRSKREYEKPSAKRRRIKEAAKRRNRYEIKNL